MQWATPATSQTNSKNLWKILQQIKNDHYPIETTYSKNNTAHHSNFEYNNQDLKIISPFLSVL